MIHAFARGACPGLASPMETGDGLLARFLPAGPIPLRALARLCAAARKHGNGTIEISARGSVQIRGLTVDSAPLLAEAISELGIDIGDGVPVFADPLPDDPAALIDANALAAELREALAASGFTLAPKVSVIVDGGGRLHLDALAADIRVRAIATANGPLLHVAVAGNGATAQPLGAVAPNETCDAVLRLLAVISFHGPEARAADVLRSDGVATFRDAIRSRIAQEPSPPRRLSTDMVGAHCLKDNLYALGVALAFSHVEAHTLGALTEIARTLGGLWGRPAPDRALLLGPFERTAIKTIRDEARRLGFVVDPSDPRRRIAACPGAPHCLHGLIAARALAAEIARQAELPAGGGIALHVSGCAKGCAHPTPSPLTVVGTEEGCGIVHGGTARDVPSEYIAAAELITLLAGEPEAAHA
jgi:precorrin-3B synthase